jgi:hypothetical protein
MGIRTSSAGPLPNLSSYIGCEIYAQDPVQSLLGIIDKKKHNIKSISNRHGLYGNRFSARSILNNYSSFGSPSGIYSPMNPNTNTPPRIFRRGVFVAYLTVNRSLTPRLDTNDLLSWIYVDN